jgi:hypothetical protein
MEDNKYSLHEEVENAKRGYIQMFNELVADENVTPEKVACINSMLEVILSFEDEE